MLVGALGPLHTFATFHRLRREPIECTSMIENFSYIRTGSLLARPEPPSDLIPIPIPVFRPAVSVADRGPAPVECAILQELAGIKREVRALRAQSATPNVSAVPLERAEVMLGCKRAQVFKLLALGRLERAPKVGRSAMITVASIEALLAVGAQQKVGTRSRRIGQRPESINSKTRTDKCKTNACMPQRDAGALIRKITI